MNSTDNLMKTVLFFLALLSQSALALISGGEGNQPVSNHGWPEGSLEVANFKTRVANWEGPPFGGGQTTFDFREESLEHLPEERRGMLAPLDEMKARRLRTLLLNKLKR